MRLRSGRSWAEIVCRTALLSAAFALTACSGSSSPGPVQTTASPIAVFDDQGGQAVSCLKHQEQLPTPAYRAGPTAVSELELPMLAYYTRGGNLPYCDGKPATAIDRAWLTTYVENGADPSHVRRNLS